MNRIEQLRKENNMSQKQFADYLKVSPGNLCDWEKGRTQPNIDRLIQISDLFNVSVDYVIGRDQEDINNGFFDKNEFSMLVTYKKLDPDNKEIINTLIKKLSKLKK